MPDLETRISQWKRSLAIAFGGSEEIVEELESHLREEIDRLTQAGHAPDAALTAAQAKLGRPIDLAAEYARTVPPARWLPILVGLPLLVLLFGYIIWLFIVPAVGHGDILLGLHDAASAGGTSVGLFTGLLGICHVLCALNRPIGLGQRRSLRRTLLLANAGATVLLLVGMALGGVSAHHRGADASVFREIADLSALLWFTALTVAQWTVPQKQHLWILLSIVTVSVNFWARIGPVLLIYPWPADLRARFVGNHLCWMVVYTAVPLSVALLGLLPAGRLRRRTA